MSATRKTDTQTSPVNDHAAHPPASETDVYAIHGADPEVLAYAMAKYSRSALTMKESLSEISAQRAEQFLNTFYFAYGHRSIADLAHIPFAIERLSLLAAIELVDEQRWDGQERSTRYQNFRLSGWFTPALAAETPIFTAAVERLFATYDKVSAGMLSALKSAIPQPESMKPEAYERTLKARAFDVARYLLPLATNTSLGQIVNARTLETQVSRLLTSEFAEIRQLGEKLRTAASEPAWNVQHAAGEVLCEEIASIDADCGRRAHEAFLRPVKAAPTLVKYANPNEYQRETRSELAHAARRPHGQPAHRPRTGSRPHRRRRVPRSRTRHLTPLPPLPLPLPPAAQPGRRPQRQPARRDHLPRHQSTAAATTSSSAASPPATASASTSSWTSAASATCTAIAAASSSSSPTPTSTATTSPSAPASPPSPKPASKPSTAKPSPPPTPPTAPCATATSPRQPQSAQYLLPLATRCRSLFKMDFAEALYISELRSGVAGHFSYRRVAWEMYKAVAKKHPSLAQYFRIEDVNEPVDLLRR